MASTQAPTRAKPAAEAQNGPQDALTGGAGGVVATQGQNALALPADLASALAGYAKNDSAKERPAVSKLSLRGGALAYMGEPVKGNNMDVVILCGIFRNVFYAGRFDPNNVVNPNCFALSEEEDDMVPHENVAEPVSDKCEGCPNAEWGSDPNSPSGRGKACKQSRRLIVLPADALESAKSVKESEMALLDVPVTSIGNWANLVNVLNTGSNIPVWAAVVNVAVRPHPKKQIELVFTPLRGIADAEIIRAIMARREDALRTALAPWDETNTEEKALAAKQAPARAKSKF